MNSKVNKVELLGGGGRKGDNFSIENLPGLAISQYKTSFLLIGEWNLLFDFNTSCANF